MSNYISNKQKDTLFINQIANLGSWQFDDKVAEVFPDMIRRSIPGYTNIITMISMLALRFVTNNSIIYDLGCSLGAASLSIFSNIKNKNYKIVIIDNSPAMIKRCHKFFNNYKNSNIPIEIIEDDILNVEIKNASMVILNFTLQFINPNNRQQLINRIYQGLNPGSILILSEKFIFDNKKIDSLLFDMHHDFKLANGYSKLEINQKHNMLKNTMLLDSINIHKTRLQVAGFNHYDLLFQCLNFGSLLAIKD